MLMTVNDFSAVITDWIDKTIVPVTKDTILRSLMRGVLAVNTMAISDTINKNKEILEQLHYMKDGLVDTDAVCTHINAAFPDGEYIDFNLKNIVPMLLGTKLESSPMNALLDRPYRLDRADAQKLVQVFSNNNNG